LKTFKSYQQPQQHVICNISNYTNFNSQYYTQNCLTQTALPSQQQNQINYTTNSNFRHIINGTSIWNNSMNQLLANTQSLITNDNENNLNSYSSTDTSIHTNNSESSLV
jgi:hypothetical protein